MLAVAVVLLMYLIGTLITLYAWRKIDEGCKDWVDEEEEHDRREESIR